MSFPDSAKIVDWLRVIQKIDWRTEAAIVTNAVLVLVLAYNDFLWFRDIPSLYLAAIAIIGMLFAFHLLFGGVDCLKNRLLKNRKTRIQRKFNKLSDGQKKLLNYIFSNRNRKFQLKTENGKDNRLQHGLPQIPLQMQPTP